MIAKNNKLNRKFFQEEKKMGDIEIEKNPSEEKLGEMGVKSWPIWSKEESEFPWQYDSDEVCFVLEGRVEVTPEGGEPVVIEKGDLVKFPKGMACTWKVTEGIKKHYNFP